MLPRFRKGGWAVGYVQLMSEPQLTSGSIGLSGVAGQSLSAMGLSGVIGTSVPIIAITAGAGGWVTWVVAAVVMLLVALSIAVLARRFATTGGLYGLASKALGPLAGLMTGWLMVLLAGVALSAGVLSFGAYFSQFLTLLHIGYGRPTLLWTSLLLLVGAWWLSRVGARPAAWVMFVAEIVTTLAMLAVFVAVLVTSRHSIFDARQLHLHGVSVSVIITAVVLGVGAFGGFESASVYGREAKNPTRAIPLSMVLSVAVAGVIWMFSSYVLFLGFQYSKVSLAKSAAPMGTLAQVAGIGWYGYVIDLALAFTLGASIIAGMSWVARMMMTMSKEGVAPKRWQAVHPRYRTPAFALGLVTLVWAVLVVLMAITSSTPLATFGDAAGDLSGFPLLLVYAIISLAAVAYLWRSGRRRSVFVAVGLIAAAAMGYVFYRSVVPWPPFSDSLIVVIFLAVTGLILVGYLVARARRVSMARIGTSVDEDTASLDLPSTVGPDSRVRSEVAPASATP